MIEAIANGLMLISSILHLVMETVLVALVIFVFIGQIKKEKGRFELGDFIAPTGKINMPSDWSRVKRVDRDKNEYLLQTWNGTTYLMTFEQAKEQCEIVECPPGSLDLWMAL
jgi:hypothetical protein